MSVFIVWAAVLYGVSPSVAAEPVRKSIRFDPSGWHQISKEEFAAAKASEKKLWMGSMYADHKLDAPGNTRGLEILDWGLRDKDEEVRRAAVSASVEFLVSLRNQCRGSNVGKLPIKRAVVADVGQALKEFFKHSDRFVRTDAVIAHIWLRGSAADCEEPALKLMNELSVNVAREWVLREKLIMFMHAVGYPPERLPLSYPHPNSRKAGEPLKGTQPAGKGSTDPKTWFDFLENSIP